MKKWVALFSHTGSEIVNVSNALNRWPDRIITNKAPRSKDFHPGITEGYARETGNEIIYCSSKPDVSQYRQLLLPDTIITLHGWMNIIPGEICDDNEIYNLHPGLITRYPELKGKDPQKRVIEEKSIHYDRVGCVIHRAAAEVDAGEVLMERSTLNIYYSEQSLTNYLHEMATDMWVYILKDLLNDEQN